MKTLLLALFVTHASPTAPQQDSNPPAPPRAEAQAAQVVVYDVRDLVANDIVDFVPVQLGIDQPRNRDAQPGEAPQLSAKEQRDAAGRTLEGLVRKYITPKLDGPEHSVRYAFDGTLVANLDGARHEWLKRFLSAQRQFQGVIKVEARVFELGRGELAKLGIDSSAMLPAVADRDALVDELTALPKATALTAPTLVVHPNQRANISVVSQLAYIKSYTVEIIEPGRKELADPEIAVINEGVVFDLRATPVDTGVLALDLALDCAEVVRPIATRKVRLSTAARNEVEIGVPEVLSSRIVSTVLVRDGASVVLSTPRQRESGELVLIVTAQRVPRAVVEPEAK